MKKWFIVLTNPGHVFVEFYMMTPKGYSPWTLDRKQAYEFQEEKYAIGLAKRLQDRYGEKGVIEVRELEV